MIILQLDSEQLNSLIQNAVRKVINDSPNATTHPTEQADQLLTIQQAGEFLKLSKPTIYALVSRSAIPVNKRGKRLYFSKQELTDWIKAGRKKTVSEIAAETDSYLSNQKKRRD